MKSVSAETLDPSFRLESHFQSQLNSNGSMVDRIFASLMLLQYVGCVIAALIVTPKTWAGTEYSVHFHVWTAVLFGGLLAIPTAISGLARSGARLNQYAFAVSQMLFSSLIIHLSGGRLESHFHIFGSIAFLAAYRDPRVILVATVVTAVDHFARALMWPHSLYGLDYVSLWRPIEHAAWVVFEDVILLFMIYKIRQEMWSISKLVQTRAQHQDSLKTELDKLRTAIAAAANGDLTVAVDSSQLEETEGLSADLKRMLADMRQMISNINQKSITVRARAEQFAHRTETIRESIESQRSSIDSIETAMNSMKDTISNIHESTDLVRAAKSEAREKAELSELAIAASERSMSELQSSSHRIDSIVEEIREIAEQTTLLSLNATIEAARAGESGKGFAVVASEVKDLARKANVAANRISELIKESLHRVDEGVSSSKKVTEQFRGIIDAVQSIDKTIADVVSATSLQAEQTQQVDVLVQEVLESSHQSAESCRSVSLDSQSFREIAEHLDQEVNRFSIGDTADMRA